MTYLRLECCKKVLNYKKQGSNTGSAIYNSSDLG